MPLRTGSSCPTKARECRNRILLDNYLVIGTASRKRAIEAAFAEPADEKRRTPYLGEKGIGRLSAMRLGDMLTVETAQKMDKRLNLLKINWSSFN